MTTITSTTKKFIREPPMPPSDDVKVLHEWRWSNGEAIAQIVLLENGRRDARWRGADWKEEPYLHSNVPFIADEIARLAARVDRLTEALRKYGQHTPVQAANGELRRCRYDHLLRENESDCDCGLREALRAE
jgi:hypothetical protein